MSDEQKPDTTDKVAAALYRFETQGGNWEWWKDKDPWRIRASFAIAAHNEELERQGYAVIKIGEIPSWMQAAPSWVNDMLDDVCGHGRRLAKSPGGIYEGQIVHRRGGEPCDDVTGLYHQTLYRVVAPIEVTDD
jgi:hypothetical protein